VGAARPRFDLWASYARFEVIPVDLVNGLGDKLLIVRGIARPSALSGHDLKILGIVEGK